MVQNLYAVVQVFALSVIGGLALKCYECDNSGNPACGEYFKAYQFDARECPYPDKCGLQRQPPEDNYIGIMRGCYTAGSLPGVNEGNGCHNWTDSRGSSFLVCFCDTDYCNGSSYISHGGGWFLSTLLTILEIIWWL
ncbi:hypothetical protein ScPMuIL_015574 [Solemya velum]